LSSGLEIKIKTGNHKNHSGLDPESSPDEQRTSCTTNGKTTGSLFFLVYGLKHIAPIFIPNPD